MQPHPAKGLFPFSSLVFVQHLGGSLHGQVFLGRFGERPIIITRLNPFFSSSPPVEAAGVQPPETPYTEIELYQNVSPHVNLVDYLGYSVRVHPHTGLAEYYLVTGHFANCATLEWVLNNVVLSAIELCTIALQVARAVTHLHCHGFVCNDLGVPNVLIDGDLNVKLFDFKLCARVGAPCKPYGPVKVFAPEAYHHLLSTFESDAYQLGCFMLTLLTRGRLPFPELTNEFVLQKRLAGVRLTPKIPRACPVWLEPIITKLLEHKPALRLHVAMAYNDLKLAKKSLIREQTCSPAQPSLPYNTKPLLF